MLPRKVIAGPAKEPLTLDEAKRWTKITTDAEDDTVLAIVMTARRHVENRTELALITRTVEVKLDGFWGGYALELPMPPLQEVVSITYVDANGVTQTLDPTTYQVSTTYRPGRVWLAYGKSWPSTRARPKARNAAERSSRTTEVSIAGCWSRAMAIAAEREPGEMTA